MTVEIVETPSDTAPLALPDTSRALMFAISDAQFSLVRDGDSTFVALEHFAHEARCIDPVAGREADQLRDDYDAGVLDPAEVLIRLYRIGLNELGRDSSAS